MCDFSHDLSVVKSIRLYPGFAEAVLQNQDATCQRAGILWLIWREQSAQDNGRNWFYLDDFLSIAANALNVSTRHARRIIEAGYGEFWRRGRYHGRATISRIGFYTFCVNHRLNPGRMVRCKTELLTGRLKTMRAVLLSATRPESGRFESRATLRKRLGVAERTTRAYDAQTDAPKQRVFKIQPFHREGESTEFQTAWQLPNVYRIGSQFWRPETVISHGKSNGSIIHAISENPKFQRDSAEIMAKGFDSDKPEKSLFRDGENDKANAWQATRKTGKSKLFRAGKSRGGAMLVRETEPPTMRQDAPNIMAELAALPA